MTAPTTTGRDEDPGHRRPLSPGLLSPAHLPFAVGAVALVTLGAFENRAVTTVLPTVADRLDGLPLFGPASAAALTTYVIALAVAGAWADHHGPAVVLRSGLVAFVVGQGLAGLAPSMTVFILGRLASGIAEGLIDVGLIVLLASALPESLRAKVFATFSAAWILPSLLGPAVAGLVAEHLGWRFVFLLALGLLGPAWLFLRPSMNAAARTAPPRTPWTPGERRAAYASVGVSLSLVALSGSGTLLGTGGAGLTGAVLLLAVAAVGLHGSLRPILPPATLTLAPGLPAIAGLRGLVSAAFGTAGAYFPLMLATVHGFRPSTAGASLMVTGTFWAVGSWVHGLDGVQSSVPPARRLRLGFGLIAVGLLGPTLLALSVVPVVVGLVLWAVAAFGMGTVSPTLSTQMLAISPPKDQGRSTAAVTLAGSVGLTVGIALAGAGVAWQAPDLPPPLFAAISGTSVLLAGVGATFAHRAGSPS